MPAPGSSSKFNNACKDFSNIHLLHCGHYVRFEAAISCHFSCSKLWPTYDYHQHHGSPLIICETCVQDRWLAVSSQKYRQHYEQLYQTVEYKNADVALQKQMGVDLGLQLGFVREYLSWIAEQKAMVEASSDVWGKLVSEEELVDDVTDIFGRAMGLGG